MIYVSRIWMWTTQVSVKSVEDLTEQYGKKIAPIHFHRSVRMRSLSGYVNVSKESRTKMDWKKARKKNVRFRNICMEYLEIYREALLESVAETSEEFMDRYFCRRRVLRA